MFRYSGSKGVVLMPRLVLSLAEVVSLATGLVMASGVCNGGSFSRPGLNRIDHAMAIPPARAAAAIRTFALFDNFILFRLDGTIRCRIILYQIK